MQILLVEDNADLGEAVESRLIQAGHAVTWVKDGDDVLPAAVGESFDAMALDLMLPNRSGFELIKLLRKAGFDAPILVMTARSEIDDKVSLLDLGADDYLVKPFDLRELEARLRALMRRTSGMTTSVLVIGNVSIDLAGRTVLVNNHDIEFGRREFRLLEILTASLGRVVPKERLMNQLFNLDNDVSTNALELYVSRLRRKLGDADLQITTARGVGYKAINRHG
ncbi:MAG TPA: response regulator transcription factor [Devosia sp.]|nr:response regulator transcription factor [Devosia sp.]